MKLVLVGSSFRRMEDGGSRYGINLLREYRKMGVQPVTIDRGLPRLPFIKAALSNLVEIPIKTVINTMDEDAICHFTRPPIAYGIPFANCKRVATIHDLIAFRNIETSAIDNMLLRKSIELAAHHSDKIITPSIQTKDELVRRMRVPKEKITVINHGIEKKFRPTKKKQDRQVIGYLGALSGRKNVSMLIEAFALMDRKFKTDAELHIWGGKSFQYSNLRAMVKRMGLEERVKFKGYVPEDRIVDVYNSFTIFAFPSMFEGFGLPILEAQRCGIPVLINERARISPEVREYCAEARGKNGFANRMHRLLTDRNLYLRLRKKGISYSKGFTWGRCARETIKVYKEI